MAGELYVYLQRHRVVNQADYGTFIAATAKIWYSTRISEAILCSDTAIRLGSCGTVTS